MYFVLEGEEESGSAGFFKAIEDNAEYFGKIDVVIISNSYWFDEETPCVTVGLRGVIHAKVTVDGHATQDVHSGVHGGAIDEPLDDMVKLLSGIRSRDLCSVTIPGFMDAVAPLTDDEEQLYRNLAKYQLRHHSAATVADVDFKSNELQQKWRQPTFTMHGITVSGNHINTVIPRAVTAAVSMRIVPN